MKQCINCKELKNYTDFYTDKRRSDKLYPRCKECHKKTMRLVNSKSENVHSRRASKYGLTLEQLYAMGDKCEVCGSTERLCVDHCHDTLTVRGLLCHNCNTALGLAKDDIKILEGLIMYLKRN